MDNITSALFSCFKEAKIFLKKLEASDNEHVWMHYLDKLESKMGLDELEVLQALKLLVMSCLSLNGLKHLMHTFLRKVSSLIDKLSLLSDEEKAYDTWKVVQNFWSLCSNQHEQLTGMGHGYSAEFHLVLPSLASVYVDLFIAANRSKTKLKKLSRRLYGWLKFELNERCMKTALLEVSEKTPDGAKIVSPILKKLLSQPPSLTSDSHLDYLLHFLLLKSWLPVCETLKEIAESSLNLKAPKTFVAWLKDNWVQSADHLPEDKSFKGRRVSELLLDLDASAVEELFVVFSNFLWSLCEEKEKPSDLKDNLFTIDKKGNESPKVNRVAERSKNKNKRKVKIVSKIVDDDNNLETDYFMLDKSSSEVPEPKRRKTAVDTDDDSLSENPGEEEEAMDFNHSGGLTESSHHDVAEEVGTTPERQAWEDLSIEVADQSVSFFVDRGAAKSADSQTGHSGAVDIEVSDEAILSSEGDQSDESELEILKDNLDVSCYTPKKPLEKGASKRNEMIDITGEKHDNSLREVMVKDSCESDDGDVEIMLTSLKPKSLRRNPKDATCDKFNNGKEKTDRIEGIKVKGNDNDIVFVSQSKLITSPLKGSPLKKVRRENEDTEVLITNVEKRQKTINYDVVLVSPAKVRPSHVKETSQDRIAVFKKTPEKPNNDVVLVSPTKVRPIPLKKSSQDEIIDVDKIRQKPSNNVVLVSPTNVRPSPLKKSSQDEIIDVDKIREKPNNDVVLVSPTKVIPILLKKSQDEIDEVEQIQEKPNNDVVLVSLIKARPSLLKKSSQDKIEVEKIQEESNNDIVLVSPTKVRPSPLKKSSLDKIDEVEKIQEEPNNDIVLVSPTKVRPSPLKKSSQDKIIDVDKIRQKPSNNDIVLVSPTKARPSPLKKSSQDKIAEVEKIQEKPNNDIVLVSPTKVRPSPLKKSSQATIEVEKIQEESNNDIVLVSPTKARPSPLKKSSQDKMAEVEKIQEKPNNDIVLVSPTKARLSPLKKSSQNQIHDVEKIQEETNNDIVFITQTKVRPSPLKKSSQDKIHDVEETQEKPNNEVLVTPTKVRPSSLKKSPSPIKKIHKEKNTFETSTVLIENKVHNLNQDASEQSPTKSVLKEAESDMSDLLCSTNQKRSENLKDSLISQRKDDEQNNGEPESVTKEKASKIIESTPDGSQSPVKNNGSGNKLDSTTVSSPPSHTEEQVGFMLAQMRKSVTKLQEKPSTLRNIKTRLRSKSEIATLPGKKAAGRSEESLSDWLRKPPLTKSEKSADPGSESPGKTDSSECDDSPRKTDSLKKLVSDKVSKRQSPRNAVKPNIELNTAKGNKAAPEVIPTRRLRTISKDSSLDGEVIPTRRLRTISLKDSSLDGGGESTEELPMVSKKASKSPLHPSPLTRSYLLRRKLLDGKCVVCSSSDSECTLHTAVVTSESPKNTLTRMKLKSSPTQSSLVSSHKRNAVTPKS